MNPFHPHVKEEALMALTLENSVSRLLGTHPYIPALAGGSTARALLLLLASNVREGKLLSLCMTYTRGKQR